MLEIWTQPSSTSEIAYSHHLHLKVCASWVLILTDHMETG